MTSTVFEAATRVLLASSYDLLSTTVGIAVAIALAILLLQHELTRLLAPERAIGSGWAFDMALVPLLFAFMVIIATRLAELLV